MSIRQKQKSITLNRIHLAEDMPFASVLAIPVLNGVKRSKRDGLGKKKRLFCHKYWLIFAKWLLQEIQFGWQIV